MGGGVQLRLQMRPNGARYGTSYQGQATTPTNWWGRTISYLATATNVCAGTYNGEQIAQLLDWAQFFRYRVRVRGAQIGRPMGVLWLYDARCTSILEPRFVIAEVRVIVSR